MINRLKDMTIIVLLIILVSMFNTKVHWEHGGKMWSYKLGNFYLERIGLRHE
jgi:hypothetical protein